MMEKLKLNKLYLVFESFINFFLNPIYPKIRVC